jgi:hypothetical protein
MATKKVGLKKMPTTILAKFKAKPVAPKTSVKKGKIPAGLAKYLAAKKATKKGG